eukprot:jgi/Mesvir1/1911/Mv22941-RA.1
MEAGDVDFEYDRNDERLLKLLGGEKIAFKRGAEPDGNCWWYAYFESKAYQARESITQAELHKRVLEKKKEIGKVIDNYLKDREKLGIGNFGPNFSQNEADWKKKIKDELKDKKWASDSMASLVAFHDKTDVYNVNTKEVTGFPGTYTMGCRLLLGGSTKEFKKARREQRPWRSENKPVYICHDGGVHYEALIPESWPSGYPSDQTGEMAPAPDNKEQREDLEAMKDTRTTTLENSVKRLEDNLQQIPETGVKELEENAYRVLEEGAERTCAHTLANMAGGGDEFITPAQMADVHFRRCIENGIMNYAGPDDPVNTLPQRPAEVVTETLPPADMDTRTGRVGDRVKKGKGKSKANARHIKDNAHPPTSKDEADESMRQFAGIEANKDIPFNYQWSPLNASIVAVRYKKVPGGLKIQVSFGRDREFMDWLLLAKSRVLAGMGISALGLYADQYLPAGKVIGLYTGRILGEFEPQTTKDLVETPLTGFRHGILTMIGDDDKLLLHSYNDGAKGVRPIVRLVDGGRGAPTSGTQIGQTYDPLGVGVIFPWTYVHMANDPRGSRDPRIGKAYYPNATFQHGSPGLKVINPIYPREEVVWEYDNAKITEGGKYIASGEGVEFGKRLWLMQRVAKKIDGAQKELDAFMMDERRDALEVAVESLEKIVEKNKRINTPKRCTGRPQRKCTEKEEKEQPDLLDDMDMRDVENALKVEGLDKKSMKKLRDLIKEYNDWRQTQAF